MTKSYPACKVEYPDKTLEFSFEDGTKLFLDENKHSKTAKTAVLEEFPRSLPNEFKISKEMIYRNNGGRLASIKNKAAYQGGKVVETAPIGVALIHNYWQWLYLNKANFSTVVGFLTSGQFSVWLNLLVVGMFTSFVALKYVKNRNFAITVGYIGD